MKTTMKKIGGHRTSLEMAVENRKIVPFDQRGCGSLVTDSLLTVTVTHQLQLQDPQPRAVGHQDVNDRPTTLDWAW